MLTHQAIALNRFGLGVRAGEAPPADPAAWLRAQVRQQPVPVPPQAAAAVRQMFQGQEAIRAAPKASRPALQVENRKMERGLYVEAVKGRAHRAVTSDVPFLEHLGHFWANHFAVSIAGKQLVIGLAGPMEEEAIRPHVLGRFADMLLAVERHPAMEIYLDQAVSIGPGSPFVTSRAVRMEKRVGLNENLAREILELHTLGVRSGYSQGDVTGLAKALTGWTVGGAIANDDVPAEQLGAFRFAADRHEPGERVLLGKRFPAGGEEQGRAILEWLALRPETARHLATKLARHFVADNPPPALVDRLAQAYLAHEGQLAPVYDALVDAPEAWASPYAKFRTPWEWLIAAGRLTQYQPAIASATVFAKLGQRVWAPSSPAGWPDTAADWAAPDALVRRVEVARALASRLRDSLDARKLADVMLVDGQGSETRNVIGGADSAEQALALLIVSPEMMRR